jgi:hypothetical protein
MSMNPRKNRRIPAGYDDFDDAIKTLNKQNEHSELSYAEIIETEANSYLPRNLKIYFGLLARQLVDRESDPGKYKEYCRALGLGAYTGVLIAEKLYGNLGFFEKAHIGLGDDELSSTDAALVMAEGANEVLDEVGEATKRWIEDRAQEALIEDNTRFWYKTGAAITLEHVAIVVNALDRARYTPYIV